jgi:Ice-binding-like
MTGLASTGSIPIPNSQVRIDKDGCMKKAYILIGLPAATMAAALMLNLYTIGGAADAGKDGSIPTNALPARVTIVSPASVNLGLASDYVILAKSGISTTGNTAVTGEIGLSPAAATGITGFSLVAPSATYANSALVNGKVYAADYASPTPANLTNSVLDMQTAYKDAASRAPDYTELGAGNIGGKTLSPGVYKWGGNVVIPTDMTLSGSANDNWIFEVGGNLSLSSSVRIILKGGALPKNVVWQVAGIADFGTASHVEGVVLSKTAIVLKNGASMNGQLLAQTAVTLDANTVLKPTL